MAWGCHVLTSRRQSTSLARMETASPGTATRPTRRSSSIVECGGCKICKRRSCSFGMFALSLAFFEFLKPRFWWRSLSKYLASQ